MKLIFLFFISFLFAFTSTANEEQDVQEPPTYLVKNLYDYCFDSFTDEETSLENFVLNCVNEDLKASDYKTFSSYSALKAAVDKEEE
ncbi:MAG: hypothetical protein ACSHW0_09340 [Thalassotalea sp.]